MIRADLVVLAIQALQVAMGKEDIDNPFFTTDGRFFPPMNADGGNIEGGIAPAPSQFAGKPVGVTFARTDGTVMKLFQRGSQGC